MDNPNRIQNPAIELDPRLPTAVLWFRILRHFLASPHGETAVGVDVLRAMYYEYKQAKKRDDGLADIRAEIDGEPERNQFEADLATLRALPHRELRKADGTINLSAVARALNRPAGGTGWAYIQDVSRALERKWQEAA